MENRPRFGFKLRIKEKAGGTGVRLIRWHGIIGTAWRIPGRDSGRSYAYDKSR